ncbi:MAG: hypothetical protein IT378_08265 [Sandaracinaceae bacterium]|nr:hypothetical protein [Sandaracinaceae bacterium]
MALHAEMERLGMPRAPVALWNAGRALANVPGREREARDVLQRFLDGTTALANEADVAEFRSAAVARIAELDARIGNDEPATTSPPTTSTEPTSSAGGSISPVGPIVLGSGIGILGVAVVFGVLAVTHEADLKNRCGGTDCPNTPENHAFYDEMRAFGAVTDVLLIIGGVTSVVGTIVTFTLNEGGRTEASASARARPGGAEVVIAGSF